MMPLGSKLARPQGSQISAKSYIEQTLKIFLSETRRPRVLIIYMDNLLVNLYQVCVNDAPGGQNQPCPMGHKVGHKGISSELLF